MTPQERQAIRERVNKATPGPWNVAAVDKLGAFDPEIDYVTNVYGSRKRICEMVPSNIPSDEQHWTDGEFIAHAREDVPKLLDEIDDFRKAEQVWQQSSLERALENKRLSDENERLRGALENIISRSEQAETQTQNREGPSFFEEDTSWWRGHSTGWQKAEEIARQGLEGSK